MISTLGCYIKNSRLYCCSKSCYSRFWIAFSIVSLWLKLCLNVVLQKYVIAKYFWLLFFPQASFNNFFQKNTYMKRCFIYDFLCTRLQFFYFKLQQNLSNFSQCKPSLFSVAIVSSNLIKTFINTFFFKNEHFMRNAFRIT